ncbi:MULTISPECIES: ribosome assembly cofactor RimP [Prochlorococcus]|uniref:ribosome assembly cofactor RimP n=1 Tax=Prochlorococcus TaxID=1218 RepID=UPI000559C5EC|nr:MULTISPECIES: ribosome assembly cofactor RimP [Prochlorococcus]
MSNQIVTNLESLACDTAANNGLEVYGFTINTDKKPMNIQVQIKKMSCEEEISLEDCVHFSEPMNEAIEQSKLLDNGYVLEISSPGLSDLLETDRDFKTFKGFPIEVRLKDKDNSELLKSGLLHERSKEYLLVNIKGRISKIPRKNIISVQLTSPTG